MERDWIIDVLADLRSFAEMNGLPATAASLEEATLVALAEVASTAARKGARAAETGAEAGAGDNVTWLFAGGDPA